MTNREVFTQALNELELYMRWYYRNIEVPKEVYERLILDRTNLLINMWLEVEGGKE